MPRNLLFENSSDTGAIKLRINDFATFMASFDATSGAEFDREFHERLAEINYLVLSSGNAQELRSYCLGATERELGLSTIISHGRRKPFGYSGDFQMIDWTYTQEIISDSSRGRLWDSFYHRQQAPIAVCERKDRFGQTLYEIRTRVHERPLRILNVGSGPAREILDGACYAGFNHHDIKVVCVDSDRKALEYSRSILGMKWDASVTYEHRNALRYRPKESFHLVWSSGLFDYLETRLAVHLLKLMWSAVAVGGRLVIGNFADTHQTRPWIELCGDWMLIHRSEKDMNELVKLAGIDSGTATIEQALDRHKAIRFLIIDRLA